MDLFLFFLRFLGVLEEATKIDQTDAKNHTASNLERVKYEPSAENATG